MTSKYRTKGTRRIIKLKQLLNNAQINNNKPKKLFVKKLLMLNNCK